MRTLPSRAAAELLAEPLTDVLGGKTAKAFEALKVKTVGDLMLHLPRRYVSGTELSDLNNLTEGEEVTVLARVRQATVHPMRSGRGRASSGCRRSSPTAPASSI